MARRNHAGIAEACLVGGDWLAIDHRDLVAVFGKLIRTGHADHASAQNDDVHEEPPSASPSAGLHHVSIARIKSQCRKIEPPTLCSDAQRHETSRRARPPKEAQ